MEGKKFNRPERKFYELSGCIIRGSICGHCVIIDCSNKNRTGETSQGGGKESLERNLKIHGTAMFKKTKIQ